MLLLTTLGVPLIAPVELLNNNPVGNDGVIANTFPPCPPVTVAALGSGYGGRWLGVGVQGVARELCSGYTNSP